MASLMDKLRALTSPKLKTGAGKSGAEDHIEVFRELSEQFRGCEDEARKAQLWQQLCTVMPDMLFLAPMCYEGDDPAAAGRDRVLHATIGAKRRYAGNEQIVKRGNPGYRLAEKADDQRMHLRTLIARKSKEVWVPLFTDFSQLLPMFGKNSRIAVISFSEASQMARSYTGLIINPGTEAFRLDQNALKRMQ